MGNDQSVRSTHFQPTKKEEVDPNDFPEEHHISISNKMVERLVEDATLAGGAASAAGTQAPPRGDYKDKIFMEKLTCLDENHSEKFGLTMEDLRSTVRRIELRTVNMVSPEPVCADCQEKVIHCYNTVHGHDRLVKCFETVVRRIELRTGNMVSPEPVCADCQEKVIHCYNTVHGHDRLVKCFETVGAFTKCVEDATTKRLRARTTKEARDHARRSRHVAHAREHVLRDLGPDSTHGDDVERDN